MTSLILLSIVLGWLLGGVANWAADRLPGYTPATPQIARPQWTHDWTLAWRWHTPRCPHCHALRPPRTLWLEVGMAAAFALTAWRLADQPWLLMAAWLYVAWLVTVLVIDLEHHRVLNVMVGPAAGVALLLGAVLPGGPGLLSALLGGAAGFALFWVLFWVGRGSLGAGDVKLAGVIGLMTGYPAIWTALVSGILLGGVAALGLLLSRRLGPRSYMAYGPYLVLGALFTVWFYWP